MQKSVYVLTAVLLFCSFGGRPHDTITGHVFLYGNVPFTSVGFETDDGHRYALVSEDGTIDVHMREKLIGLQGQLVKLHGRVHSPKNAEKAGIALLRDGEFVVYSYEAAGVSGIEE